MIEERNPYVGPRTFGPADASLFFGREVEARGLARLVAIEQVTVLYGASGVGKSSLIHARLIPALQREGYVVLPVGRVGGELPDGVAQVDNIFVFNLLLSLDEGGDPGRTAHVTLHDFLASRVSNQLLVLVIDQFEEIFTGHLGRWHERTDFFRQLSQALTDHPSLAVVLTVREDYIAALDSYAPLFAGRLRARFHVERMGVDAALDAIRKPAELGGRPFAPGVAEQLADELRRMRMPGQEGTVAGQYIEPVQLQVVCYQLWEGLKVEEEGLRPDHDLQPATHYITEADLRAAGDLDSALTQFYEETLAAALAAPAAAGVSERQLRIWFDRELITETGTRGTVHQGDGTTGGLPNGVVQTLQNRFLVRGEARGGHTWIELVHDRFVEPILSSNRMWLQQHEDLLQRQAALWEERGRSDDLLLSGDTLAQAERWALAHTSELSPHERAFLTASLRARTEALRERQQSRRIRTLAAVAAAVAVLAVVIAFYAYASQKRAASAEAIARIEADKALAAADEARAAEIEAQKATRRVKANELAAAAVLEINNPVFDPSLPLLLAIEGANRTLSVDGYVAPNAGAALQDVVTAVRRINWQRTLRGHTDGIGSAAFSPDGRYIVTASVDGTARIWDAATGQEMRALSGHTGGVNAAAYSPDGATIVTASRDGTARVWDAASAQEVRQLSGHTAGVISAAFSPDGKTIVTASADGTARLWDAATGQVLRTLTGHASQAWDAAFSPDGRFIVTAGCERTDDAGICREGAARIWNASSGQEVHTLTGYTGRVVSAAFSPDNKTIVTAGCDRVNETGACQDGSARIWDATTWLETRTLTGHAGEILSAAFSPDGKTIVTAGADWTARVWDASTGQQVRPLTGHTKGVWSATYSPVGEQIVTASADGTARIWGASSGESARRLTGHDSWVWSAAYSPDGRTIVTASADGTARIWDAGTGAALRRLAGHTDGIGSAAFSPDGRYIVTASVDGTARIWDAATGREMRALSGHTGGVNAAAYSPDGATIVTASRDGTARVWDAASAQEVRQLSGHTAGVISAAFSPDGKTIVTASADGTARLWDAATGQVLRTLTGHASQAWDAAFSPDGRFIVTAGCERTDDAGICREGAARIWNASSGQEVHTLTGYTGRVVSAAFSPDNKTIVTAGCDRVNETGACQDGSARIWDATTWLETRTLTGHAGEILSAAFSPDGKTIVTAGADWTARVWDASIEELLKEAGRLIQRDPPQFTQEERQRYELD